MERLASCSCGALRARLSGEPATVALCHCNDCKKRTGSSFGVGVFYGRECAEVSGASSVYRRQGGSGKNIDFHFCLHCGTTVYWLPDIRPALVAIALGAFDDRDGLAPKLSGHEERRDAWVVIETPNARPAS